MRLPRSRLKCWGRRFCHFCLFSGLGFACLSIAFLLASHHAQPDFHPIHESLSPELRSAIDAIPQYRRAVAATYLSFPEWYLVFNPQEYGEFLHNHRPSGFPYGKSIRQFWSSYIQVYAIAQRHYPHNFGENLMVVVIGTSSTVEWVIKGIYENTIGRVSEWSSHGADTAEDVFAADVAREYGEFVPTRPWFEFQFGKKFKQLWSTTGFFGPHFIRKCERKVFLSLEYGVKYVYAAAIEVGSHSVYGVADTQIYTSVTNFSPSAASNPAIKTIVALEAGSRIITLPHYQGFSDTVPQLACAGMDFQEVAGNSEILVTIIAPTSWTYNLRVGNPLFSMELVSNPKLQRVAIQAPVKQLGSMLREMDERELTVEHLFDY